LDRGMRVLLFSLLACGIGFGEPEKLKRWSSAEVEKCLEETVIEKVDIEYMTLAEAVDHVRGLIEAAAGDGERLRIAYSRESGHEPRRRVIIKMEDAKLKMVLGALAMQARRNVLIHPDGVDVDPGNWTG